MKLTSTFVAGALFALAGAAQANTVPFSDDFSGDALGLNAVPTGWSITNGGTVDIVGGTGPTSSFAFLCSGTINCVDLDGSSGKSGQLVNSIFLNPGTYSLSFVLGGNQRLDQTDTVAVNFGTTSTSFSVGQFSPYVTESVSFATGTAGTYNFGFLDNSSNNVGAILESVQIAAVPEPETWALMGLGLVVLGGAAWRRSRGLSFASSASALA